jgi:hypothetical protein
MEYLIIFSIAFMMTLPLVVIYAKQTSNIHADITNAQVYKTASKIIDYAEQVYYLGPPSQRTLIITFPEGIRSVTIVDNTVVFNVTTADLSYQVVRDTAVNLTGHIKAFSGQHVLILRAESGYVNITDK